MLNVCYDGFNTFSGWDGGLSFDRIVSTAGFFSFTSSSIYKNRTSILIKKKSIASV